MAAEELFGHLPTNELIEENGAFRNAGNGTFELESTWALGSRAGGRGMESADMDNDGDLDIVVNNLMAPAQLLENRLCSGDSLMVDLAWPDSGNSRAIGSQVVLHTDAGTLTREVRTTSGYLSGDPARLHFGFLPEFELQELEIISGLTVSGRSLTHQRETCC